VQSPLALYVPLRQLWVGFNPMGVDKGIFVVSTFQGYIDESHDGAANLFTLSCIVATGKEWQETARAWKLHLAAKNKQLKREGRPLISRYHASQCNGRRGEFDGWSDSERDAFVLGLFGILKRSTGGYHSVAYDVHLDELCEVFPEWAGDRMETAYAVLPKFVTWTLGEDFRNMSKGGRTKITLFHDRTGGDGKYDPTVLKAFNSQMNDPDFPYKDYFTTIAPLKWEDCIALQPADLVAFECMKQAKAKLEAKRMRKSFTALLDMDSFGIHTKSFTKDILEKLRELMENKGQAAPNLTA